MSTSPSVLIHRQARSSRQSPFLGDHAGQSTSSLEIVFLPSGRVAVSEESEVEEPTTIVSRRLSFEELSMQQEGAQCNEMDYP